MAMAVFALVCGIVFWGRDNSAALKRQLDIANAKLESLEASLRELAKTSDIPDVSGYAKKDDLSKYATKDEIKRRQPPDLSGYATKTDLAAAFPVGSVVAFAGDVSQIPPGWLLCDGRQLKVSEYEKLSDVLGEVYGRREAKPEPGSAVAPVYFRIPDCRGLFLRGVNGERKWIDGHAADTAGKERTLGSVQDNDVQCDIKRNGGREVRILGHITTHGGFTHAIPDVRPTSGYYINPIEQPGNVGQTETRPKNIAVQYIIKAK